MAFLIWAIPETRNPRIWRFCFVFAIVGLIGYMVFDVSRYLIGSGKANEGFMRAVFAMITSTDFPFVAVAVGSVINGWLTRRWKKVQNAKTEVNEAEFS